MCWGSLGSVWFVLLGMDMMAAVAAPGAAHARCACEARWLHRQARGTLGAAHHLTRGVGTDVARWRPCPCSKCMEARVQRMHDVPAKRDGFTGKGHGARGS